MGMRLLSNSARHPRLTAWVVLATISIGVMIIVSLGRDLDAWQYIGLSFLAVVFAGVCVALTFADGPGHDRGD